MIGAVEEDAFFRIVDVAMVPVTVTSGSGSLIVTATEFPNTVMLALSENTLYGDDSAAWKSTLHSIISQKQSNIKNGKCNGLHDSFTKTIRLVK